MRGAYPGSFNPPTIGHLAIIEAAITQHQLTALDLIISRAALGKGVVERPSLEDRVAVLEASVVHLGGVRVEVTDRQLIADIAAGYDVVVMGADKWRQINDVSFYDDHNHLEASLARLPRLAIAGRGDDLVPDHARLVVPTAIDHISSSAARAGSREFMTAPARAYDLETGAWTAARPS